MASQKISQLTALATPADGDYVPVVDITETAGTNARNKRMLLSVLAQFVLGNCKLYEFSISSGSAAAVAVPFGETLSPTPDWFVVLGAYQANADTYKVPVSEVNGSLSATQCQVQAASTEHTGIEGAILVHQPAS